MKLTDEIKRAMELCPVEWASEAGSTRYTHVLHPQGPLLWDVMSWKVKGRGYDQQSVMVDDYEAFALMEKAWRERLAEKCGSLDFDFNAKSVPPKWSLYVTDAYPFFEAATLLDALAAAIIAAFGEEG